MLLILPKRELQCSTREIGFEIVRHKMSGHGKSLTFVSIVQRLKGGYTNQSLWYQQVRSKVHTTRGDVHARTCDRCFEKPRAN